MPKEQSEAKKKEEYIFEKEYEIYSDLFYLHTKKNMFVLSFGQAIDSPNRFLARVWMDAESTKVLYDFLGEQIKDYEKKYGKIK
jgi:hypothetical protein